MFTDPSDPNYEFKYDASGNLVRVKKGEKLPGQRIPLNFTTITRNMCV